MKNMVIWVEDRPDTVFEQISFLKKQKYDVKIVSTAHDLKQILEENQDNVAFIIIDIMLFSVMSLDSIDIIGIDTIFGYEAGWLIAEHLLRKDGKYTEIPILILSARSIENDKFKRLKSFEGELVEYIEKGKEDVEGRYWTDQFKNIVKTFRDRTKG